MWTWDIVYDTSVRGDKLRMLNVLDEYTRECLCIYVGWWIYAANVKRGMADVIDLHGAPEHIRSITCSEFIKDKLRRWLADNKIKTLYIEPESPRYNRYTESFNAHLHD